VTRHAYALLVFNAVVMATMTVLISLSLGYPLRDPDGFLGPAWVRMPMLLVIAFAVDVVPRTLWRCRGNPGRLMEEGRVLVREHWTRDRIQLVVLGLVCFYITYVSYRNLKNFLPFVRPLAHNDYMLHDFDHWLLFGHDPATILHTVLGTTVAAHVLSWVYLIFLPMVPVSVAVWLVWSRNVSFGYWYVTADCLTWTLGTLSYYALPTLGPNFFFPWLYQTLDRTGVTSLQDALFYGRQNIRFNPFSDGVQSVAGFASLHVGITLMMALVAQYTVRSVLLRTALWVYLGLVTISTSYFGWHYLADDIAGVFIAFTAFYVAALASGQKFERHGRRSHPTTTTGDVPVESSAR
jgi:hypothetical protein